MQLSVSLRCLNIVAWWMLLSMHLSWNQNLRFRLGLNSFNKDSYLKSNNNNNNQTNTYILLLSTRLSLRLKLAIYRLHLIKRLSIEPKTPISWFLPQFEIVVRFRATNNDFVKLEPPRGSPDLERLTWLKQTNKQTNRKKSIVYF